MSEQKRFAIVRIRGLIGVRHDVKKTLQMFRLYRKNYCVVVDITPITQGMVKKIKDYATWGEIDDDTFKILVEKRGELFKQKETDSKKIIKYKFLQIGDKKYRPFFRLCPPKGGFERKGIKISFNAGGALGYRKEKINDLIRRMI